jgi:hypothetical protein
MQRNTAVACVAGVLLLTAAAASAQQSAPANWPGWTFTPSFGVGQTYDDNITLFGESRLDNRNDDVVTAYSPQAELTYNAPHTRFGTGYRGSFLNYRSFGVFNRWDQRANLSVRRAESPRLDWSAGGSMTSQPSTDALDFAGIPFSHTGSTAWDGRAGVDYKLTQRDAIAGAFMAQRVRFDRPDELLPYLQGGSSLEWSGSYHRRINHRLRASGRYSLRHARTTGDEETIVFHVTRGGVEYALSPAWTLNAAAGIDRVAATELMPAQGAPGFAVGVGHTAEGGRRFLAGYQRMFMPSFGYGGAIQSHDLSVLYHAPFGGYRRLYTEISSDYRDSRPLVESPIRLPLRSFRVQSSLGWAPRPWVRIEGFYARTVQSTLIPGGRVERNRIGFVIITSRSMRMQ